MASPQHPSETRQQVVKTKNEFPDEFTEIMIRSLQVGAGTGNSRAPENLGDMFETDMDWNRCVWIALRSNGWHCP